MSRMGVREPLALALAGLLALGGCASSQSPVLYPNARLKQVGREQADRDIAECRRLAGEYVQSTAAKDVAKGTAVGGVAGAAIGAVGGAVSGRGAGVGAAVGAATGATAGAVHGAVKQTAPSPVYKQYVDRCLRERGYDVIGWQ
jgi:outer membrane lipoprotein SlyB